MKPLKDFEGSKHEPTTSVQMKVELRKMGKTNLFMIIVIMMIMIRNILIRQSKKNFLIMIDNYDENNDDFDENDDDFDCERDLARSGQWCSVNFSQLG